MKTEFDKLITKEGLFSDPAANIKKLLREIVYKLSMSEQIDIFQSAINGVQKVGLTKFNKECGKITTKEELVKYLDSVK